MTEKEFEDMNLAKRKESDFKLDPSKHIIMMLDGRSFSKFCKQFDQPFDDWFVDTMNKTAQYLCQHIQNARMAFVQSDEISIYIEKCAEETQPWFNARIQKMCSVAAGMASAFFTKRLILRNIGDTHSPFANSIAYCTELVQFDCRVWNVDTDEEVQDWFVYRQKDCIRNSKQQFAQAYIPHKELLNKSCDQQIEMCKEATWGCMDWSELEDGLKHGRIIYKKMENFYNEERDEYYERSVWKAKSLLGKVKIF